MQLLSTIIMSIMNIFMIHQINAMGLAQQEHLSPIAAQNMLNQAISTYKPHLAETALANNANVNYTDQLAGVFETPLHNIASLLKEPIDAHYSNNFANLMQIATLLLNSGANVNSVNQFGMPVLHSLISFENPIPQGFEILLSRDTITFAKLLLQHGAQVNQLDEFDQTPLEHAHSAPLSIVRFLLNNGADYKSVIKTMLERAQDLDISEQERAASGAVAQLLKSYQDLDQKPARDILKEATEQGFIQLVTKALQAGAIPTQENLQAAAEQYNTTYEEVYKDIGKILIQNMGLTEQQSRVATTGVQAGLKRPSGEQFPAEIIEYIRTFL